MCVTKPSGTVIGEIWSTNTHLELETRIHSLTHLQKVLLHQFCLNNVVFASVLNCMQHN